MEDSFSNRKSPVCLCAYPSVYMKRDTVQYNRQLTNNADVRHGILPIQVFPCLISALLVKLPTVLHSITLCINILTVHSLTHSDLLNLSFQRICKQQYNSTTEMEQLQLFLTDTPSCFVNLFSQKLSIRVSTTGCL